MRNARPVSFDEKEVSLSDVCAIPVKGSLLRHQQDSVKWMMNRERRFKSGGILADDMGLGKTYQVVALLRGNKVDSRRGTLIVTVVSTVEQWAGVLINFGGFCPYKVMAGHKCPIPSNVDVVLTTYSVFQRATVPACLNRDWGRIVLDEGHVIRNASNRLYREMTNMIRFKQYRWILSGTPVQNDESELKTLLTWVGCKEGDAERARCIFRRTVPHVMEKYPGSFRMPPLSTKVKYLFFKYPEERRLYFRMNPPCMRRLADCQEDGRKSLFLQAVLRQRQACIHPRLLQACNYSLVELSALMNKRDDMSYEGDDGACTNSSKLAVINSEFDEFTLLGLSPEELFEVQKGQLRDARDAADRAESLEAELLARIACMSAIRICCEPPFEEEQEEDEQMSESSADIDLRDLSDLENPKECSEYLLFDDQSSDPILPAMERSTKFDYICRKLDADVAKQRKALVFCQYKMEMHLLAQRLDDMGIAYLSLDGDQKQCNRQCVLYNFENQRSVSVLIIQIKAGGVGLNLQSASRVYITSPDWNPVVELQAISRAHRINQKRPVKCVRVVMAGTVEELNCLQKESVKLSIISKCLNEGDFSAQKMGIKEQQYGENVVNMCKHYRMLEKLRWLTS